MQTHRSLLPRADAPNRDLGQKIGNQLQITRRHDDGNAFASAKLRPGPRRIHLAQLARDRSLDDMPLAIEGESLEDDLALLQRAFHSHQSALANRHRGDTVTQPSPLRPFGAFGFLTFGCGECAERHRI